MVNGAVMVPAETGKARLFVVTVAGCTPNPATLAVAPPPPVKVTVWLLLTAVVGV